MGSLEIHPELRAHLEVAAQQDGSVRGNSALALYDGVDPLDGDAQIARKFGLGESHGLQEFLQQHLPGMIGNSVSGNHTWFTFSGNRRSELRRLRLVPI